MGMKSSDFSGRSNRGRDLESLVLASQGNVVTLTKISAGQKWLKGGKTVAQKQFVDFVGCVNATGRMICFDCKQWDEPKCRLDLVSDFQQDMLVKYHLANAISGLLIESTRLGKFFWFGVCDYKKNPIEWNDDYLICIGPSTHTVNFSAIPGVRQPKQNGVNP